MVDGGGSVWMDTAYVLLLCTFCVLTWKQLDIGAFWVVLEALEFLTCEDARGSAGSSTLSGAALDHSRSQLSDSSSFSFTVPPAVAGMNGSFHIRMRLGVNTGVIGSNWVFEANTSVANCTWLNPLTHCDGVSWQQLVFGSSISVSVLLALISNVLIMRHLRDSFSSHPS